METSCTTNFRHCPHLTIDTLRSGRQSEAANGLPTIMGQWVDRWISSEQFEVWTLAHGDYVHIHSLSTSIHQVKHNRLTLTAFILTLVRFCTSISWLAFSCCTITHSFSHITHVQHGHWIKIFFFYYLMTTAEAPSTPPNNLLKYHNMLLFDLY